MNPYTFYKGIPNSRKVTNRSNSSKVTNDSHQSDGII